MYVTGLEPVGKTSLVKVGLTLLGREGAIGVYLPLGRALGPVGGGPSDMVLSMLERIEDSVLRGLPDLVDPQLNLSNHEVHYSRLAD